MFDNVKNALYFLFIFWNFSRNSKVSCFKKAIKLENILRLHILIMNYFDFQFFGLHPRFLTMNGSAISDQIQRGNNHYGAQHQYAAISPVSQDDCPSPSVMTDRLIPKSPF